MTDWRRQICFDPNIARGKATVKNTRLSVDFILGQFASGWTEPQVLENYPSLTEEGLRAVFAFAAETLGDEAMYPPSRESG